VIISDSDMWDRGVPAITYSLRGLCALEVFLKTANTDLHSGMFGGGVQNANHLLVQLLSTLHDDNGKVRPTFRRNKLKHWALMKKSKKDIRLNGINGW
jgi:acetylornithine deacetylase/succinyl-diaminopimelate desuccinylase-like protein